MLIQLFHGSLNRKNLKQDFAQKAHEAIREIFPGMLACLTLR
jgi:hypothetical protein